MPQEVKATGRKRPGKQTKQSAGAAALSLAQLRARAATRVRGLSDLTAELKRQCEAAIAECSRLQAELAECATSEPIPRSSEDPTPDCANCALRRELDCARAANARLRTDFAELVGFLEEISALLMPTGETGSLPRSP